MIVRIAATALALSVALAIYAAVSISRIGAKADAALPVVSSGRQRTPLVLESDSEAMSLIAKGTYTDDNGLLQEVIVDTPVLTNPEGEPRETTDQWEARHQARIDFANGLNENITWET